MGEHAVVVAGAGLAAAKMVERLRRGGFSGPITMVGDEAQRPYERPDLSKKLLQGEREETDLFVHPEDWYATHDVDTAFGLSVELVDRARQRVMLSSGDDLAYDTLVLATGARPRALAIPGTHLEGVLQLRTLDDSRALRARLEPGTRWVLIGAGWIGLEVAAAARLAGCEVTVLETAPAPLRVLGPRLGAYFADLHRSHGVDLRFGVKVLGIAHQGNRATGVETSDGLVPADVVLVGVGAVPNDELAARAQLPVDNGIVVDEHLRTADPAVLAVGDVANAYNVALGRHLRVEHWDNAIRQGRLAAATILRRDEAYDWQPYFYTDQYDLGMEYVGRNAPTDAVVIRGHEDSGEFIAFWQDEGRVTAAMNVNVWDVNDTLRAIVGRVVPAARLANTAIPLADIAARPAA